MTLQNLKYVICSGRYGSFCGRQAHISQSHCPLHQSELEAELGTQLFLRSNRGIQPTPDGEDFLRYAREIVEQSRALERRYRHRRYAPTRFAVSTQRLPAPSGIPGVYGGQLSWVAAMISPSGSAQPIPLLVTWLLEKVMWGG